MRCFVAGFAVCLLPAALALLPNAAMSQAQLEDLGGPRWQTPPLKNFDRYSFLRKVFVPILENEGYRVISVEEGLGCDAVSPEKEITDGWRQGAFERLTYRSRLVELRQNNQASYKIYIAQMRVERKEGWQAQWLPKATPEGADPFPSLH